MILLILEVIVMLIFSYVNQLMSRHYVQLFLMCVSECVPARETEIENVNSIERNDLNYFTHYIVRKNFYSQKNFMSCHLYHQSSNIIQ